MDGNVMTTTVQPDRVMSQLYCCDYEYIGGNSLSLCKTVI